MVCGDEPGERATRRAIAVAGEQPNSPTGRDARAWLRACVRVTDGVTVNLVKDDRENSQPPNTVLGLRDMAKCNAKCRNTVPLCVT